MEATEPGNDSILAKFVTKQEQYAIPGASISIPIEFDTEKLNEVVNKFRKQADRDDEVVFDFIINGDYLGLPLSEHLAEREISTEALLEIEYLERQPPPKPQDSLQHDDWVSTVHSCGPWLLTGCYDNTVHIWSSEGVKAGQGEKAHKLAVKAHRAPVKAVSWIPKHDESSNEYRFVSCGIDQNAMLWSWNTVTNKATCEAEYRGHTQSVECIGVSEDGKKFATGSWDTLLKIWSTDENQEDDEPEMKKRRRDSRKDKTKRFTPLMTLAGHTESVSGVAWLDDQSLLTSSWDHTVRLWDTEIGGVISQISGNVAFFCIAWSPINRTVLASCADRFIRMYDPRSSEGSVVKRKFTSHKKWVSSVKWSPTDEHLFMSGGHDTLVKLWDSRSPNAPLYDLTGHEDQVLAVDWSQPEQLVSGSADTTVKVFGKDSQTS